MPDEQAEPARPARYPIPTVDELLRCFDATSTGTFARICRLVGGDVPLASSILSAVYVSARPAPAATGVVESGSAAPTAIDVDWLYARAADLSAQVVGRDVVGGRLSSIAGGGDDDLRDSERWLDDESRERARAAIVAGVPLLLPVAGLSASATVDALPDRAAVPSGPTEPATGRLPRRRGIVTALGAVAIATTVIAFGLGDPSDEERSGSTIGSSTSLEATTSPTRPTRPPLTVPTTTSLPFRALDPGFVLDTIPDAFRLVEAYQPTPEDAAAETSIALGGDGSFGLWAEPGAARTVGRWFAALIVECAAGAPSDVVRGGTRISVGDGTGVVQMSTDGVSQLTTVPGADIPVVQVRGFGFTPAELAVIAASIEIPAFARACDPEPNPYGSIEFTDASATLRDGLRPRRHDEGRDRMSPVLDVPAQRRVLYLVPDESAFLSVAVRRGSVEPDPDFEFLTVQPSAAVVPQGLTSLRFGSSDVLDEPSMPSGSSTSFVQWAHGDEVVTMAGSGLSVETLLSLAASVRPATEVEWLIALGVQWPDDVSVAETTPDASPSYRLVATSPSAAGGTWTLLLSADPGWLRLSMSGGAPFEQEFEADPIRPVIEFVTLDSTLLVVAIRGVATGSSVRISARGAVIASSPLGQVDESGLFGALVAVREIGPYTVELIGADGAVVSTLQG